MQVTTSETHSLKLQYVGEVMGHFVDKLEFEILSLDIVIISPKGIDYLLLYSNNNNKSINSLPLPGID